MAGHVQCKVEHVLLLLARSGKPGEIPGVDDDMAGRAGHLALARPFERLAGGLGDIEQPLAGGSLDFLHVRTVGGDEPNQGHEAKLD